MKKNHARHRSYSNFRPPLKNDIFTVGVKSISKMSFLRSMGSTKKSASYGAWEAHFWVLQHLRSETTTFFLALSPQRGVKKGKMWFPRCMGIKKKMLLTEHGKQIFHFCNPSRLILLFLAGFARFWPVLAGSGRFWQVLAGLLPVLWHFSPSFTPTTRAGGQDYVSLHHKLPQIKIRQEGGYMTWGDFSNLAITFDHDL